MPTTHRSHPDLGASSVEYALVVFAIAAMIAAVVFALGTLTQQTYEDSCTRLRDKMSPPAQCS